MADCILITSTTGKRIPLSVYPYLGVGYLASALERNGYSVKLIDVDAGLHSMHSILRVLVEEKPVLTGYSILSRSLPFFRALTPLIRKTLPETCILGGGPHPTADPGIISKLGADWGIMGDGETSLPVILESLKSGKPVPSDLPGLIRPCSGGVTTNPFPKDLLIDPSLDPAYHLYPLDAYCDIVYPGVRSFSIETSRGCIYNCNFCSNHSKSKLRYYPLETVERQVSTLVDQHQVKWIAFVDDLFTFNKERVVTLCETILNEGWKFRWSCLTRADHLDDEMLKIMAAAGLHNIIFGVESGSDLVRAGDNKRIRNEQYSHAIRMCDKYGIRSLNTYIFGHPGEKLRDMTSSIIHSIRLNPHLTHYQLMSPLPDSPLFEQGISEGLWNKDSWAEYIDRKSVV